VIESFIIIGQDIASVQFGNDKTLIESRDQIEKSILNLKKIVQDFEKMALGSRLFYVFQQHIRNMQIYYTQSRKNHKNG
jgi:hypothetical protein